MPTVLRWRGYRFYFFSNEGNELPHVHVDKDVNTVKFWLSDGSVVRNFGFGARDLATIADKVREEREHFIEAWHEYFGR